MRTIGGTKRANTFVFSPWPSKKRFRARYVFGLGEAPSTFIEGLAAQCAAHGEIEGVSAGSDAAFLQLVLQSLRT